MRNGLQNGDGKIGVLAVQGAFAKHRQMLASIGIESIEVRHSKDLNNCIGLILPGGESTTMLHHLLERELLDPLKEFARSFPFFGTCAGMILMSRQGPLKILDITVERNAYGRQSASFSTNCSIELQKPQTITGVFIRAPRISTLHSPDIQVLATMQEVPICVRQHHHLATSFHPELTDNPALHHYFVALCSKKI